MENLKITAYEDGVEKLPDYPSDEGYTAEMLKAVFDARSNKEIKEKHNALCDRAAEISEALKEHKESPEAHTELFEDVRELVTKKIEEESASNLTCGEGEVSLEQKAWSDASKNSATEKGAVAFGGYNKANGKCAMAVNYNNEVNAPNAFAANAANKIPEDAEGAFVAGKNNEAKGVFQAVFGTYGKVEVNDAFVVGNGQNESGRQNAFKVDKAGNAETKTLKAENSVTTKSVVAQGKSYVGCGVITEKEPNFAQNIVEGQGAAAFGGNNKIYGRNGFALMTANVIPKDYESVFIAGHANTAAASHQAIFGTYASPEPNDAFVIGNGNNTARKNAFAVNKSGNVRIGGTQITLAGTVITEDDAKALKAPRETIAKNTIQEYKLGDYTEEEKKLPISTGIFESAVQEWLSYSDILTGKIEELRALITAQTAEGEGE